MWDSRRGQLLFSHESRQQLIQFAIRAVALSVFVVGAIIAEPRVTYADTNFWKNSVVTGNWSNGNNWSATSAAGSDNAGPPLQDEPTNIVNTDGVARTVNYDVNAPAAGFGAVSIDLTGPGTTTNTLSLTTNNSFIANDGLNVGGFGGIVGTAGRGTLTQTAGSVSTTNGTDMAVGYGANSTGIYNLNSAGGTGTFSAIQSEYIGLHGTGTLNQGAGTNTIQAGTVGALDVGTFSDAHGTYNLSGGTINSNKSEYVGDQGTGRFNQTGGTNNILFNTINNTASSLYLGFSGGNGSYTVSNSAVLSVNGDINLGTSGNSFGQLTVQDQATVSVGGNLRLGDSGAGTLFVDNKAVVNTNGLFINTVSSVQLTGGTIRMSNTDDLGLDHLNYISGTIQLAGNRAIGTDEVVTILFGAVPTIAGDKALNIEGTATIDTALTLNGGAFRANGLVVNGSFQFSGGTFEMTGGTITGLNSLAIPTGGEFRATGVQSLTIAGAAGSAITATGSLTLGSASAVNGFYTDGTLTVAANSVTLNDANDATFDSGALVSLGSGANSGTLTSANGLTLDFGGNATGFGTISTPNNSAKPLINNGHITGNSVAQPITLSGYVKGVGTFSNVNFSGTFSPGFSPALISAGNLAFAPTSTLLIELGGTARGSAYDAIVASGSLGAAGVLQLALINGFNPSAGDSFDILDWGSLNGNFNSLVLPSLAAGLTWNTSALYTSGVLSVAATAGVPGDYNSNGIVDAADYTVWRDHLGQTFALPNRSSANTGPISTADYDVWKSNFGNHSGSGASAGVPEPSTLLMLLVGMMTLCCRRRPKVS
jgi:hypothetical protein